MNVAPKAGLVGADRLDRAGAAREIDDLRVADAGVVVLFAAIEYVPLGAHCSDHVTSTLVIWISPFQRSIRQSS